MPRCIHMVLPTVNHRLDQFDSVVGCLDLHVDSVSIMSNTLSTDDVHDTDQKPPESVSLPAASPPLMLRERSFWPS